MDWRNDAVRCLILMQVISVVLPRTGLAQFDPPRIAKIFHKRDKGSSAFDPGKPNYYINKGQEASIFKGNELNVYRERFVFPGQRVPMRMFIGTLKIELAQQGSAVGSFEPNKTAIERPIIKYKTPMKGDVVVPRIALNSGVLFAPGDISLKAGAAQEFDNIANFVRNFAPSKLVIEGHTDSDGTAETNQTLSQNRANQVRNYLISEYEFITPDMVDAVGYGEDRPLVEDTTPENKALNRRIEVIIWE